MTPDQEAGLGGQDAPHLAKFGLLSEPFTGPAGPNFFYADANREQRLDLMQHLAPYSEVLIVIGGPGAGKTMLLQQFIARAGETWRTAVVSARPGMSGEEFTAAVMDAFGLPMDASIPLERRRTVLIDHLRALRQGARMPILIVDDAEHLDAEAMELMLSLCEENEAEHLLSMILFGTPQLQAALASPALAPLQNRVAHTFDVPPFSEHDTGRYLRHRMRAAGARDEGPFTPDMVGKIHAAAGGVPSVINEMAHHVLTDQLGAAAAARPGRPGAASGPAAAPSGGRGIDKRWIAAGVAGLAIVAVLVAGRFGGEKTPTERTASLSLPSEPPQEESRVLREEAAPADTQPAPPQTPPSDVATEALLPPAAEPPPAAPSATPPATPAPPSSAPVVQETPPAAPARPATPSAPAKAPDQAAAPPPAKATATTAGAVKREDWVRQQPASHFTLQLMALKEEKTVRETIAQHHLQNEAAYFPIKRNGQTLYVLVYGSYPSREAANRAARELPTGVVSGQPWVRNFKALHKEVGK